MPRYKKKKHNRILSAPKKRAKAQIKKRQIDEDIVMTSSKSPKTKSNSKPETKIKVIEGGKLERSRKFKVIVSAVAVIAVVLIIIEALMPAGLFQTVSNAVTTIGTGSYPIAVSGGETLSVVPISNYYYHLTDTHISAYSNGGKILFSEAHGYERAVLCASKGRALIYNQGGKEFLIFNLKGEKYSLKTEDEIICGDISDSGTFAVVTYSPSYASAVTVYNSRGKIVYEWYSAENTINSIAVSSSGKKIAISTYNSTSGVFNSKVHIIGFKSATPEYTKQIDGEIVYGLECSNKSGFNIIKSNGIDTVKWSSFKENAYTDDYKISYFRDSGGTNVGVFTRDSDKTDNKIVIFSKNGKVKKIIRYKGIINDIEVRGSNAYCINDTTVSVLDFDGNVKFTADYGFGGEGIAVSSANVVAVITDSEIKRIKLSERN